jgi:peroxiredoxin
MLQLTSTDFRGLFNRRFAVNFFPRPATNHLALGQVVPSFELPAVGDRTISLADYIRPAKTTHALTLLYFTRIFTEKQYCPLCFPHIVAMNNAHPTFSDRGVEVLMITSTDLSQSQHVARDLGLTLPLLSDPSCQVFRTYRTGQALGAPLPAQFLIDRQGRLQFRHLFSFLEPNASIPRLLEAIKHYKSTSNDSDA